MMETRTIWIEVLAGSWPDWADQPYRSDLRLGRILKRRPTLKQRQTDGYWIRVKVPVDVTKFAHLLEAS
jgi:hypothetical protein